MRPSTSPGSPHRILSSSNLPSAFPPCGFVAGICALTDGTGRVEGSGGNGSQPDGGDRRIGAPQRRENGILNP